MIVTVILIVIGIGIVMVIVKKWGLLCLSSSYCHYSNTPRTSDFLFKLECMISHSRFLADMTRDARQEALLTQLMASGSPPQDPVLTALDPNAELSADEAFDPTTAIELRWTSPKGDLVSFYTLECAGPAPVLKTNNYKVDFVFLFHFFLLVSVRIFPVIHKFRSMLFFIFCLVFVYLIPHTFPFII